ncbi:MAG: 50S ribosomal protein L13 [Bacteroidetes bacterium]|nr:50S ribosomal protein L13 [Bacteroidota bacterium]HET6243745.1 50S ribosomal protein L13 [Bacteroidia bacterium]
MDALSYKTVSANKETTRKEWVLIDAEGQVLGRLASKVAKIIRGKHRPDFTPHIDGGDNVIIINAEKVVLTGNKTQEKVYIRHTGYPGGQRFTTPKELLGKKPAEVINKAVKGMLPKGRLGRAINGNLHVFAGAVHNHEAQQPKTINLNSIK